MCFLNHLYVLFNEFKAAFLKTLFMNQCSLQMKLQDPTTSCRAAGCLTLQDSFYPLLSLDSTWTAS